MYPDRLPSNNNDSSKDYERIIPPPPVAFSVQFSKITYYYRYHYLEESAIRREVIHWQVSETAFLHL